DVVLPGVFCLPRHLGTPVHAANGLTDVVSRHDLVSICAACFKARTMARFDNSILNELYSNPLASRMIASATIWKFSLVAVLAVQYHLGFGVSPRLVRDTTKRNPRFFDRVAGQFECGRNRHERERIGGTITHLQIRVMIGKSLRRQIDRQNDLVPTEIRVDVW